MEIFAYSPTRVSTRPVHGKNNGVVALVDIPKDTVISVEIPIVGKMATALKEMENSRFVDELYPRNGTHIEKLLLCSFGSDKKEYVLAPFTSHYNHHCKYNTFHRRITIPWKGKNHHFVVSCTTKEIKTGEELVIMYHDDIRHDENEPKKEQEHQDFICDCGLSKTQRTKLFGLLSTDYYTKKLDNNRILLSLLNMYFQNEQDDMTLLDLEFVEAGFKYMEEAKAKWENKPFTDELASSLLDGVNDTIKKDRI